MDVLRDTIRTARKGHLCDYCGFEIAKGKTYNSQTNIADCGIYTWKSHFDCDKLAHKLNMFDNYWCDEGVDSEHFQEIIYDYLDGKNVEYKDWQEAYEKATELLLGQEQEEQP